MESVYNEGRNDEITTKTKRETRIAMKTMTVEQKVKIRDEYINALKRYIVVRSLVKLIGDIEDIDDVNEKKLKRKGITIEERPGCQSLKISIDRDIFLGDLIKECFDKLENVKGESTTCFESVIDRLFPKSFSSYASKVNPWGMSSGKNSWGLVTPISRINIDIDRSNRNQRVSDVVKKSSTVAQRLTKIINDNSAFDLNRNIDGDFENLESAISEVVMA